jgi:DNA-binding beta-propeller fold protein YncE
MRTARTHGAIARRPATLFAVLVASISALGLQPAIAAASAGFGPLSGPGGCLVGPGESGTDGCGTGKALIGPGAVAVSPDGANVYVASGKVGPTVATSFGSLVILRREPATGAITEVGCWSSDGTDGRDGASGACTPTPSLLGADGVTVSPDGLSVFVTSSFSGSVVAFARNPTDGSLTRLGCFQYLLVGGLPCPYGNVFVSSGSLVASADNRSLYIAAPTVGSISTFTTGLTEPPQSAGLPAATSALTVASLFTAPAPQGLDNPCIAVNGFDGACSVGVATQGLDSLTLSPGGKQLYAAAPGSNAVDVFTPDDAGALTESSCVKVDAPAGLCSSSKLMTSPTSLAISPNGQNVYAADSTDGNGKVDVFSRDATSGALTETSCVDFLPPVKHPEGKEEEEQEEEEKHEPASPDRCTSVPGLESVDVLAVSSDGSAVYAIGSDSAVIFSRDPLTGKLTEASCADNEDSRCTSMPSLDGVDGAAISPDGREVYVTARGSGEVIVFGLGAAVTTSQASATTAGVARVAVACPRVLTRSCSGRVMLLRSVAYRSGSAQRRHRDRVRRVGVGGSAGFAIRPGGRATISVRISRSSRGLLLSHRRLRVMAVVLAKPLAGGSGYGRRITLRLNR